MGLIKFMSSTVGRLSRVLAGIALIVIGVALGGAWSTLSVVGLVPLFAGASNVCLLAPALGQPFRGR
jgi:hypothetical protein